VGSFVEDDLGVGGVGEVFGQLDGVDELAGLVGQTEGDGLLSGEDAAVGDVGEGGIVEAAAGFDDIFEAGVVLVDHGLHDGAFGVGEGLEGRAHVFEGAAFDGLGASANLGERAADVHCVEDDTDAAEDAGRLDDEFVGRAGDVVGTAGGDVLCGGDDGLVGVIAEAHDDVVHGIGGGDGSAWGVNAEDDSVNGGVVLGLVHLLREEANRVFGWSEEGSGACVEEEAFDFDDGDFAREEAFSVKDDFLFEGLGVFDGSDEEAGDAASSKPKEGEGVAGGRESPHNMQEVVAIAHGDVLKVEVSGFTRGICTVAYAVSKRRFAELVEEALAGVPEPFASHLEEVSVEVRGRPSRKQLKDAGLEADELLLGLYTGCPLTDRSVEQSGRLPDAILIFQEDIEVVSESEADVVREIRTTVLHEIGHHFGMEEGDLEDLGYG